jgi:hypothetical protein
VTGMADLIPTSDNPGLHVSKPSKSTPASGNYACHCGAEDQAYGDTNVKAMVENYTGHQQGHAKERGR